LTSHKLFFRFLKKVFKRRNFLLQNGKIYGKIYTEKICYEEIYDETEALAFYPHKTHQQINQEMEIN